MSSIDDETMLVRALDVATRVADQVTDSGAEQSGLLLETMLGRYILNYEARQVWELINGQHTFSEIVDCVAATTGQPSTELVTPIRALCEQMTELGLAEVA